MKYLISVISIIPLVFATIIYIAFRKVNCLICGIFESTIGTSNVVQFSEITQGYFNLSSVNVNSLPSALWVFSTAFISTRSYFKTKLAWYVWITLPLVYSVGLEVLQSMKFTDGTYDYFDILYSLVGWIIAMFVAKVIDIKTNGLMIPYHFLTLFYLALILGNVW